MDAIHGGARRWLLLALLPSAIATRAACSLLAITPGVPPAHDDDAHLRLSEACAALYKRDRDAINETVREWAEAAGWETEMHRGSDGLDYRAFAPEAPS